jgi:hypothetical protein
MFVADVVAGTVDCCNARGLRMSPPHFPRALPTDTDPRLCVGAWGTHVIFQWL